MTKSILSWMLNSLLKRISILIILFCHKIKQGSIQEILSSVQSLSHVWLCDPMNRSTPGLPIHHQLLESTQTHVHWISDAIQQSHHLSSPSPPALYLSQHQGLFKWVSSSHQVAKVLEFFFLLEILSVLLFFFFLTLQYCIGFGIYQHESTTGIHMFPVSPSKEHPGLISFRMDWLDLLAVQGILKSLLQHHSSKASILRHSAFFRVPTLTSIHNHWKNHKPWLDGPLLTK